MPNPGWILFQLITFLICFDNIFWSKISSPRVLFSFAYNFCWSVSTIEPSSQSPSFGLTPLPKFSHHRLDDPRRRRNRRARFCPGAFLCDEYAPGETNLKCQPVWFVEVKIRSQFQANHDLLWDFLFFLEKYLELE